MTMRTMMNRTKTPPATKVEERRTSIDAERRLYVIPCGRGYTCLGFDFALRRATEVARWAGLPTPRETPGTLEAYAEYDRIMRLGARYANEQGKRCEAELVSELVRLEGCRVEVTYPDGEKRRFIVGKSSGWLPCHLEIKRRDSTGGSAVYFPPGSKVRAC